MRKTSTRMLALALSAVMAIGSFTGFGGEVKAYAAEDAQAVVAADVAIPGDASPTDPQIDASNFSVSLSTSSYVYDGAAKKPTVKIIGTVKGKRVTLKNGTDYACTYANNTYPGTATVKITYKDKYKGTNKVNFKISKAKISKIVSTQTANSITLKWSAIKGTTQYKLFRYDNNKWVEVYKDTRNKAAVKKLKANSAYKFMVKAYLTKGKTSVEIGQTSTFARYTNPAKPVGGVGGVSYLRKNKKEITSSTANSVDIGFNSVAGADGYIIYRYDPTGKKWVEHKNAISTGGSGYAKNKTYYTVGGLKAATGYMFKVAAYKWRRVDGKSTKYVGEKSEVIKSATIPGRKYGYDECYIQQQSRSGRLTSKKFYRVEFSNIAKNTGYFININKFSNGKQKTVKIIKTNKKLNDISVPNNTPRTSYSITVDPYIVYGGVTYVNIWYTEKDYGKSRKGNMRTRLSKLAGVSQTSSNPWYTYTISKDKNGKITGYNINIQKMKKISANSYRTVVSIVKNYNKKMKYIGMTKNVYNTHTTYYYNAKNKLVKYVKDVYVPNTNTIMGYDEYDGNGKLVRSVRW